MKKKILIALLFVLMAATIVSANEVMKFSESNHRVAIDGKKLEVTDKMFISNGVNYIQLRYICEALGADVSWSRTSREIDIFTNNNDGSFDESTDNKKGDSADRKKGAFMQTPEGFETKDAIPDAEIALAVGRAILEAYTGRPMDMETEKRILKLKVSFNRGVILGKHREYWTIWQDWMIKPNIVGVGPAYPRVVLDKTTGEIISICTVDGQYDQFKDY